jgi:hypothetical protein
VRHVQMFSHTTDAHAGCCGRFTLHHPAGACTFPLLTCQVATGTAPYAPEFTIHIATLEPQSAPRRISVLPLRFARCRVQTIATAVRVCAPLPRRLLRQLWHGIHLLQLYMRSPDAHADSVSLAGETNRRLLRLRTPRAFMWMHRLHGGVLVPATSCLIPKVGLLLGVKGVGTESLAASGCRNRGDQMSRLGLPTREAGVGGGFDRC